MLRGMCSKGEVALLGTSEVVYQGSTSTFCLSCRPSSHSAAPYPREICIDNQTLSSWKYLIWPSTNTSAVAKSLHQTMLLPAALPSPIRTSHSGIVSGLSLLAVLDSLGKD